MRKLRRCPVHNLQPDGERARGPRTRRIHDMQRVLSRDKVEVLHQDHESVVIANNKDTELFPGDTVVQHNAFGLSLALKAGAGEEGGGHHHHHH